MNHPDAPRAELASAPAARLLDAIRTIRASVGDGLNDDELTRLLRQTALPVEAGFAFLSFSEGFVTLTVPPQDPAKWYPEKGWIMPGKEQIARGIAARYGLSLCEPPDQSSHLLLPASELPAVHHHLELINPVETVVVAHPQYLKIRLYGAPPTARYLCNGQPPLVLGQDVLHDLAALYQA